jgi:hypothetical protein
MILWTIQHEHVYKTLKATGIFTLDSTDYITRDKMILNAYDW